MEEQKCAYCQKVVDKNNGFIEELTSDDVTVQNYICADCKEKRTHDEAKAKTSLNSSHNWMRVALGGVGGGIVGLAVFVAVSLLFQSYFWYFVLIIVGAMALITNRLVQVYSMLQIVFLIGCGIISYFVSVNIVEILSAVQNNVIGFGDLLSLQGVLTVMWYLPLSILSDWFHLGAFGVVILLSFRLFPRVISSQAKYKLLK